MAICVFIVKVACNKELIYFKLAFGEELSEFRVRYGYLDDLVELEEGFPSSVLMPLDKNLQVVGVECLPELNLVGDGLLFL